MEKREESYWEIWRGAEEREVRPNREEVEMVPTVLNEKECEAEGGEWWLEDEGFVRLGERQLWCISLNEPKELLFYVLFY